MRWRLWCMNQSPNALLDRESQFLFWFPRQTSLDFHKFLSYRKYWINFRTTSLVLLQRRHSKKIYYSDLTPNPNSVRLQHHPLAHSTKILADPEARAKESDEYFYFKRYEAYRYHKEDNQKQSQSNSSSKAKINNHWKSFWARLNNIRKLEWKTWISVPRTGQILNTILPGISPPMGHR